METDLDYGRPAKVIPPIHTHVPNIEPLRKMTDTCDRIVSSCIESY